MDVRHTGNGQEYIFQYEDKVEEFPESHNDYTSGLLRSRVIFEDHNGYSKFMTEFVLKFSSWDIKEKVL